MVKVENKTTANSGATNLAMDCVLKHFPYHIAAYTTSSATYELGRWYTITQSFHVLLLSHLKENYETFTTNVPLSIVIVECITACEKILGMNFAIQFWSSQPHVHVTSLSPRICSSDQPKLL